MSRLWRTDGRRRILVQLKGEEGSEEGDLADAESHGIESSTPIFKKKFESDVNPLIMWFPLQIWICCWNKNNEFTKLFHTLAEQGLI